MTTVVSDASPLIALARIGQFTLLERLYQPLVIPTAVYRDVVTRGAGRPGAAEVTAGLQQGWLRMQSPSKLIAGPFGRLHEGEIEAISLALETASDLLMDEGPGRRRAALEKVFVLGTLDLLILAKRLGHIPAIRPQLDALVQANFYLDRARYQEALQKAGE